MASLADQLSSDLAEAMRAGDTRRRNAIRFLRAAIKNAEIDLHRPLTDEEIQSVIRTQIKQRRDSIEMFRKGKRDDLADEESAQIEVLTPYLPAQLDDLELQAIISAIVEETGATSPKDMSKVMPVAVNEIGGRAEGRRVSQAVSDELRRRAAATPS